MIAESSGEHRHHISGPEGGSVPSVPVDAGSGLSEASRGTLEGGMFIPRGWTRAELEESVFDPEGVAARHREQARVDTVALEDAIASANARAELSRLEASPRPLTPDFWD